MTRGATGAWPDSAAVAVICPGAMGAGIAQVAADAGRRVRLFDAAPEAAVRGRERAAADLDGLASRGKLDQGNVGVLVDRITPVATIGDLAGGELVIEAIHRGSRRQAESVGGGRGCSWSRGDHRFEHSSISITAIGRGLARPGRFIGMHVFNPAPVMKLVEVFRTAPGASLLRS